MSRTTPLSAVIDEYDAARGDDGDGAWAFAVAWRLIDRGVESDVIREGLAEDLELVRQASEAPGELFGAPQSRADELYQQWVGEGRRILSYEPLISWRDLPSSSALLAGLTAFLMTLVLYWDGPTVTWTVGLLLTPVALGFGACAALATWHAVQRRASHAAAAGAALAVILSVAFAQALVFVVGNDHPLGTAGVWWMLLVAFGCFALSRALDRPPLPLKHSSDPPDDVEWVVRASAALRANNSLSEGRIRDVVAEARHHAQESGSLLYEEFGAPEVYASALAVDNRARARRRAWALGALGLLAGMLAVTEPRSWSSAAVTVIYLSWAGLEFARSINRRRH